MLGWLDRILWGEDDEPVRFIVRVPTRGWSDSREESLAVAMQDRFGAVKIGQYADALEAMFTDGQKAQADAFLTWSRKRGYRPRLSRVRS